jgi:hypothetical protein
MLPDTADESDRYRRKRTPRTAPGLRGRELEELRQKLDALLLLGLERDLSDEEQLRLEVLTRMLGAGLDASALDEAGIDDPSMQRPGEATFHGGGPHDAPTRECTTAGPRVSRMGSPRPDAARRREVWRQARRRGEA